ncbi:hypothetical protein RI129_001686 [Pyrocoelia pectoralis]|uniref:Condensin complex subunit 2 n=1 Tax=Pyrocoelia pectoralis TaxID=417401 RepID=A0AAN7ZTT2_9COLE
MSDVNQDENVRNVQRRTIFDNPNRLSRIVQSPLPTDNEIKEHFRLCLKLYTENRISAKNVWKLKLIDFLRNVFMSKSQEENPSLQVAGTSLDVGTKIYAIRVDDVHSDGMRLASNMLPVNPEQETGNYYTFRNEYITNNNTQNQGNEAPKRNKARRQAMILKNPESLLSDIPKLPSTLFKIENDSERNLTSNLLTNTISIDHLSYTLPLLSEEKWWQDYKVNKTYPKKNYKFDINKSDSFAICTPFSEFEIDQWDVDGENDEINEINQGLNFENAPLYELDGTLLNNLDKQQVGGEVEEDYIVNFHPKVTRRIANDYSFTSAIKLHNNKVMDRVWTGPSHWKLKYLQPTCSCIHFETNFVLTWIILASKFSGQLKEKSSNKKRRLHNFTIINFDLDFPKMDKTKLYKPKGINSNFDPIKCTLPEKIYLENKNSPLMLKPQTYIPNKFLDINMNRATRENVAQNGSKHSFGSGFQSNSSIHDEGNVCKQQRPDMDCLVDAPEMVENVYLPQALHYKKMDMKKLKKALWKSLLKKVGIDQKQLYSEVYEKLPEHLTKKMRDNLTCPLAFVSLLHLANERNLKFEKSGENDFTIEEQNQFVRDN